MESPPVLTSQLRDKALLALEDAVQECRYRSPRPSFAVRFALAYLWIYSGADRAPFDAFWEKLREPHTPWSFTPANIALGRIYAAIGVERSEAVSFAMWDRWYRHEVGKARDRGSAPVTRKGEPATADPPPPPDDLSS